MKPQHHRRIKKRATTTRTWSDQKLEAGRVRRQMSHRRLPSPRPIRGLWESSGPSIDRQAVFNPFEAEQCPSRLDDTEGASDPTKWRASINIVLRRELAYISEVFIPTRPIVSLGSMSSPIGISTTIF